MTVTVTIATMGTEGVKSTDIHVQSDFKDAAEAAEYQQMFGEVLEDAGSKGHGSGNFNVHVSLDGPEASGVGNSQNGFKTLAAANEFGIVLGRTMLDFHSNLLDIAKESGAGPGAPQRARDRGRSQGKGKGHGKG